MAALFKKKKDIVLSKQPKEDMLTCPSCGEEVVKSVVIKKKYICPKCNYYFRVRTKNRIRMVVDEDTFTPWCTELDTETIANPLDFPEYEDPDDIALEPFDFYAFGVGYCTNKYSTFLSERKNIDNEISARCHQDRSDEGIVRYRSPVPYRQNVTVIFNNEEPFIYEVEILVDTYADDILNTELIYDHLSEHGIIYDEISMPFSIIEQPFNQFDVQKIEGRKNCV